jgi:hypothetical protein
LRVRCHLEAQEGREPRRYPKLLLGRTSDNVAADSQSAAVH